MPGEETPQFSIKVSSSMLCKCGACWKKPRMLPRAAAAVCCRPGSPRTLTRKLMYLIANRSVSFLLSFLSGGWVGMSFLSLAKALLTFCCLHRSLVLVKIFLVILKVLQSKGEGERMLDTSGFHAGCSSRGSANCGPAASTQKMLGISNFCPLWPMPLSYMSCTDSP